MPASTARSRRRASHSTGRTGRRTHGRPWRCMSSRAYVFPQRYQHMDYRYPILRIRWGASSMSRSEGRRQGGGGGGTEGEREGERGGGTEEEMGDEKNYEKNRYGLLGASCTRATQATLILSPPPSSLLHVSPLGSAFSPSVPLDSLLPAAYCDSVFPGDASSWLACSSPLSKTGCALRKREEKSARHLRMAC